MAELTAKTKQPKKEQYLFLPLPIGNSETTSVSGDTLPCKIEESN